MKDNTTVFTAKPRYELLDGLRGVAALMVIWYHIFEGFATSPLDQKFNHGYLAVDFFFILSGFVIGYAYDDRWTKMKTGQFFKRRLIRLHPMVILGAIFGTAAFLIQGGVQWNGTEVATGSIIVSLILGILLLPCFPGGYGEVRGNGEMFPLNGPSWSLFFEYIGNIMYALFLRRLPTKWLRAFVIASGLGYASFALLNGSGAYHMGVGWTMADHNFIGGFLRLSFSFSAGLRAESWQIKAQSLGYEQKPEEVTPYKRSDFALFPSAYVSWSLPKNNELQVNFTRRICRPWGGQLNTFRNIS